MEKKSNVYYIGFNANNAICNELFFEGSITLYPNHEKGNIYYSDVPLSDIKSAEFLKNYQAYIYHTAMKIQAEQPNVEFLCFNAKIKKICKELKDLPIIEDSMDAISDFLNNKYETRKYVKNMIPTLDYIWLKGKDLDYANLTKQMGTEQFVVQAINGAGGENTFLIHSKEELNAFTESENFYGISQYVKNIPLNATLVISQEDILYLPISAQLILLRDNRFKYYGGDFSYVKNLPKPVIDKVYEYSEKLGKHLQKEGYRGILGIDYILKENQDVFFMEINPRFQASSFLINMVLEQKFNTCLGEQHYLAIKNQKLVDLPDFFIDSSFINCNKKESFNDLADFETVFNGYFEGNESSYYRKVFSRSILCNKDFERLS